jgi:hypothetical protein
MTPSNPDPLREAAHTVLTALDETGDNGETLAEFVGIEDQRDALAAALSAAPSAALAQARPPADEGLRAALASQDQQIAKWAYAESQAADRKDWPMADRWRNLAQGAASAIEAIRAALAAQPAPGLDVEPHLPRCEHGAIREPCIPCSDPAGQYNLGREVGIREGILRERAQARPPADEGLRAAVAAYVAWQYRQRGAPRFTLTDLRAALASQPAPAPGLDVERLGTAMSEAWPADEQLVDDSEVWHRFAPLVVTEYVRLERTPR